jgi:hypothetical protein
MKYKIALVIIALAVVIVGAAIIYGRSLVRTGKEKRELHRRRVEDEERERLFAKPEDDDTKTWPVIDWEKRYAELVEITAARTDQAKEKDDKLPEGC